MIADGSKIYGVVFGHVPEEVRVSMAWDLIKTTNCIDSEVLKDFEDKIKDVLETGEVLEYDVDWFPEEDESEE